MDPESDRSFFHSEMFSDVKVTYWGKTRNLHRIFLCRSEWFRKALTGSFEEATSRTINIYAFDAKKLDFLLEYIYTNDMDLKPFMEHSSMVTSCMDVFDLGDYFLLPKLRDRGLQLFKEDLITKLVSLQKTEALEDVKDIDQYISLYREIYGRKTPAGAAFKKAFLEFIHQARYRLFREDKFVALIDEDNQFGADILKNMLSSGEFTKVYYPGRCTGCEAGWGVRASNPYTHAILPKCMLEAYCRSCKKGQPSTTEDWNKRHEEWAALKGAAYPNSNG